MSPDVNFLFVIGAQRCGTSSLRDMLDRHPDVEMARPFTPETKWFLQPNHMPDVHAFVDELFDRSGSPSWRGEKATSYIEHPEAADRIASAIPDARIIVVVREPISRAVSNYGFTVTNGLEKRPIDVALSPGTPPRPWDSQRFSVSPFAYLERGLYVDHIAPWFERFGSAVTIMLFEELIAGRAAPDLFHSLGLRSDGGVPPLRRVNGSPEPLAWPAPRVIEELEHFFADSNASLGRLLDRDLSEWSKPRRRAQRNG